MEINLNSKITPGFVILTQYDPNNHKDPRKFCTLRWLFNHGERGNTSTISPRYIHSRMTSFPHFALAISNIEWLSELITMARVVLCSPRFCEWPPSHCCLMLLDLYFLNWTTFHLLFFNELLILFLCDQLIEFLILFLFDQLIEFNLESNFDFHST